MQAGFQFFQILFRNTVRNTGLLVSINIFPTAVGTMSAMSKPRALTSPEHPHQHGMTATAESYITWALYHTFELMSLSHYSKVCLAVSLCPLSASLSQQRENKKL